MAIADGLNEQLFDEMTIRMLYYKLYPFIVKDFLDRSDVKELIGERNIEVLVNAGISVRVAGAAGTMKGATKAPGKGKAIFTYRGDVPLQGAKQKEIDYTTRRKTGNVTEKASGSLPT